MVRLPHKPEPPSPLPPFSTANFSTPVVSTSGPSTPGQELTFVCNSTNGYPEPKLYWINRTDNSPINGSLQNSTVSLNERGLYDVVSILRIPWTPHVDVSCWVENVVLHQNLTSISQAGEAQAGAQGLKEHPGCGIREAQSHKQTPYRWSLSGSGSERLLASEGRDGDCCPGLKQ